MNSFKSFLLVSGLLYTITVSGQERIYFDKDRKECTADKMEYYRETTIRGSSILIKDFYKSGVLKMEGAVSNASPGNEIFEGKVIMYYPNGKTLGIGSYTKGKLSGASQTFDAQGRISTDFTYSPGDRFSGKRYVYKGDWKNDSGFDYLEEYKDSWKIKQTLFDGNIKGTRSEIFYKKNIVSLVKYYGENGILIGRRPLLEDKRALNVEYYNNPMKVLIIQKFKKNGTIRKSLLFAKNGGLLQEQEINKKDGYQRSFNPQGGKIGELIYAYDQNVKGIIPEQGEDVQYNYVYDSDDNPIGQQIGNIDFYEKGKHLHRKDFNEQGKLIKDTFYKDSDRLKINYFDTEGNPKGAVTFINDKPYNGMFWNEGIEETYIEGVLQGTRVFFNNGKLLSEKKLDATKGMYHITSYDNNQKIIFNYSLPVSPDPCCSYFTADVTQYFNGKPVYTAIIRNGLLQSGRIKLKFDKSTKEMESSGKWIITKTYDDSGRLVIESKVLAEKQEKQDYAYEDYIHEEDLLYNELRGHIESTPEEINKNTEEAKESDLWITTKVLDDAGNVVREDQILSEKQK